MLSNFEIRMKSPTEWDVVVDGKKLDNVRSVQLRLEEECVPIMLVTLYGGKATITGKAQTCVCHDDDIPVLHYT